MAESCNDTVTETIESSNDKTWNAGSEKENRLPQSVQWKWPHILGEGKFLVMFGGRVSSMEYYW